MAHLQCCLAFQACSLSSVTGDLISITSLDVLESLDVQTNEEYNVVRLRSYLGPYYRHLLILEIPKVKTFSFAILIACGSV